ncbi:hypothetical protein [Porphyromonas cangingivalis]|uniref:hypothetical protein n=1 Tax=Porphyromonas cangingivalis TaxID=36874 RepID=UPI0024302CB3|nr:hypothetical protein [Porphyromonas cangingivalis]
MNRTISSLSLSAYDILAVLAPGIIFIYPVFPWTQSSGEAETLGVQHKWVIIFLFIVVAYIVGLLWKTIMELTFNPWLRNNSEAISEAHSEIKKNFTDFKYPDSITEYYKAYYYLQKRGALGTISTLEKQIAFVRNTLPLGGLLIAFTTKGNPVSLSLSYLIIVTSIAVLAFIAWCINNCKPKKWITTIPGIVLFILSFLHGFVFIENLNISDTIPMVILYLILLCGSICWIWMTQNKIYELVWEGYYFYSKDEK